MSQNFDLEKFSQEFDRRMGKSSDSAQYQGYKPPSISLDNTGEISIEHQNSGEEGGFVSAPPVEDVLSLYGSLENSVQNEVQDIGSGLHALKNNMNLSPLEARKLQLASGLPPNFVDMDPGFARKKIASDQYAESLQAFSDNIHQTPNTLGFLREADAIEQLAITQDRPLAEIERSVDSEGLGFFNSGVIGTARNAWDVGMVGRELNKLYLKEMYGSSLTDEEEQQMRVFTSALNYYDNLGDKMPLPQRMVRGTVGSVAVPLYGSAEGGVRGLTRLGTTMASAGAIYGALAGGGVFSAPTAVAGAMSGLGAAATGGAVLDMMEQEGAAIYGTLRAMEDESGNKIDRDVARTLAVIGGGISGGLEYASFHMLGRMVPQLERLIAPEAAATSLKYLQQHPSLMAKVGDTLKSALRAFAGETSTEVAQEGVSIVAEELGRKLSNVNSAGQSADDIKERLWQTAQQAAEAMAIPIAAGGGVRLARGVKAQERMDTAMQTARDYQNNLMDTVAKAAQSSEVFKDMPETGEALLQHLSDSGVTPGHIFIKPETVQKIFFQDENPDLVQAARDMGVTPESLEENLTLGTDVAVDFSKAATHILREPERYEAMRPDMRFDPAMPTDMEIGALEGMNEDNNARLEYLNSILDPIVDEENQALSRHEARMETVAPYVQQMQNAGFSEAQAKAYGTILAANAERMGEVFGMTPKEYLESRLAGYMAMTPDEFRGLGNSDLEGIDRDRAYSQLMDDLGVKKGMGRVKKRRILQPEFAYAWGKVNPENIINTYGKDAYNELRQQFGPGFFAKKGEGQGLDALAHSFFSENRAGYELSRGEIDTESFAEKVMMPHDEFETNFRKSVGQGMLWQDRLKKAKDRIKYDDATAELVGSVTPEMAENLPLGKPGNIILLPKDLQHIEDEHGEQIRGLGYSDAREFVNHVLSHVDAIYQGNTNRKFELVFRDDKPKSRIIAKLEFREEGDHYEIKTAGLVREKYYDKRTPLWERANSALFQEENPSATRHASQRGQSGERLNLTLFSTGVNNSPRGGMRQLADGRYVVALFQKADASTILHETAHFWLEELRDAAKLDSSPEWVREAWAKLQQAYGFDGTLEGQESAARWTETQERFAREFEAYAREGKAPSWELQSAFNKFRNWITDIYKSVKTLLGADNISPAASEVFDSLLATQEEIDLSQRRANSGSVMDLLGDSVRPELRDKYAKAAQAAYDNASAAIANRRLVERRRVEREFKAAATESVNSSPVHTMLQALRIEGIDFDALKQAISEDVAYKLRDKWKGNRWEGKALIRPGGKLDLLDVAARFNEDTVQGLAAKLMETPTKREAISAEVQQQLQTWERDFDAEVEYTSAMDQAMAIEMEAITGNKQPSPAALRREVDLLVGAKKLKDVDAQYKALMARLQSEARGARKAWVEAKKESRENMADMRSEFRAKIAGMREQERIRRAALGAAYRTRMERDNIVSQLRKVANSKTINDAYQQQILRIISSWKGLGTESMAPRDVQAMPSLSDFMQSNVSLFEEPSTLAPDWLLSGATGRAGDLSITQLRDLHSLVKELAHMGRIHDRMLASREKSRISVVASNCAQQMGKLSQRRFLSDREGVLGTIQGALRKGLSSLTSVRFLARALDGFTDNGVNHDAWLNPLQQAQTDELKLRRQMGDLLREALSPIVQAGRMTKAFTMDGVALQKDVARLWKGMWDMDKVYSVAMNMGNAGNIKALMRGYGWTEQDLHAITSRMTEAEWRAVEKTWDAIDTLYPRLNEVYQAMKGVPLPKVEAQELTVATADGKTITLKGGYYPLIFDHRLSGKAAELTSADQMLNGMEAVLRSPNPKSGMTKARQGGTLPPRLSLDVIDQHVNDTTHYVTHVLPLRDTMRLFNNADFKEAFAGAAGQENYSQLLPWLRGIARPGGEQATGMLAVMDWLARRGTMYALGANMKSALLQLTSVGNSWGEVGAGNFFKASATILSSPLQSWQTIREKSAYMQQRAMLMDDTLRREYERMRNNGVGGVRFMGAQYALDTVQRAQFALISSLDAAVAYPTWLAAYDKAIASGLEESVAIARADGAVVAAQGGGGALDTPSVMRQAGLMRMLCPFMSFALSDFNRKMEQVRGLTEWARTGNSSMAPAKAFQAFAFQWVMPVALSALLVSLGRDDDLPDEEDYAWEAAGFLSMGIPVVRDITRMAESHFSSDGFKGGRTPLMLAGLDNAIRGAGHAATALEEDDDDATYLALKETTNAVGFLLGLGTPQLWRTIEGSNAYFVDDEGGVLAPLLGKPRARKD
ncbi:hypothetical protein [uncultured Desulfovibrio sp.]|uniref:hypothetical protein n=1 Tax=uncultured Desulfovibrio sp. TaxID=167968 RepID=UPI0026322864|nr:hypothetical protein [uncultured Desulfovibrio sp.]